MNPPGRRPGIEGPHAGGIDPEPTRAASSLSPPRPTKRGGGPDDSTGSPGPTSRDGSSATAPPTSTWPALDQVRGLAAAGGQAAADQSRRRGGGGAQELTRRLLRPTRRLLGRPPGSPASPARGPRAACVLRRAGLGRPPAVFLAGGLLGRGLLGRRPSWPAPSWPAQSPSAPGPPPGQSGFQVGQIGLGGQAEHADSWAADLPADRRRSSCSVPLRLALDHVVHGLLGLLLGGVARLASSRRNSSARARAVSRKSAPASWYLLESRRR